jgi:hypothetical protein
MRTLAASHQSVFSIAIAVVFGCQLASCAVLPERWSGFQDPTAEQQIDIKAATLYANKVNRELLDLHDQFLLVEEGLTAGAIGSGVAFAIATAYNGTKDLLAALVLSGGFFVALDAASSAPQKIKIINEGRSEISCAIATAPRLQSTIPAPSNPNGDLEGLAGNPNSSAQQELLHLANTLNAKLPANSNAHMVAATATSSAALGIMSTLLATTAVIQDADFKAAVLKVSLIAPTPAQYLTDTTSDVAHSIFDLLDQKNPTVAALFNKARAMKEPPSDAQAAVKKAAAVTEQAKTLTAYVQSVAVSANVDVADPGAVANAASAASHKLDENAKTLTVLDDILQKAQNCTNRGAQVWDVTE